MHLFLYLDAEKPMHRFTTDLRHLPRKGDTIYASSDCEARVTDVVHVFGEAHPEVVLSVLKGDDPELWEEVGFAWQT